MNALISLVPPALAIIFIAFTKKPLLSLFISTFIGSWLVVYEHGTSKIIEILSKIILDPWNFKLVIGLLLLGSFIGIIEMALHKKSITSKILNSKKKILIKGWITGMLLFIDDYFNILLNGILMNSFAKKYNISKEKVALVIHSLGVSSCVLVPFSTWTIYIVSLLKNIPIENAMELFVQSIPFNFYGIGLVLITFAVIFFEINILKMKAKEEEVFVQNVSEDNQEMTYLSAVLPAIVLLISAVMLILFFTKLSFNGLKNFDLTNVLIISALIGIVFSIFYYHKKLKLKRFKFVRASFKGANGMYEAVGILFFAWLLGSITTSLNTADVVSVVVSSFNNSTLYILTFLLASGLSFITSSWATFGIVIPILVPLSINMGSNPAVVLAAIIAGGVFGDHNSPISSTTIITKAASKIKIMDHFHTQLPYSLIAFLISIYLFFLVGRV